MQQHCTPSSRLHCTALLAVMGSAQAGTLVYTPTNPTFGGNPLNGSYLFNSAQAQNQYTQSSANGGRAASEALRHPGRSSRNN